MNIRKNRIPSVSSVALVALAVGFIVGTLNPRWPQSPPATASHPIPAVEADSNAKLVRADADAAALHDMNDYALRHLGVFEDDLKSFDGANDWSTRWRLRWMDVHVQGGTVRIYHVTDKLDDRRRFTTTWNGDEARWERVW